MSVADLLESIASLPRAEKRQLADLLNAQLAKEEAGASAVEPIVLLPEDNCPYSAEELARMRRQEVGRPLSEIWRSLGRT